MTGEKEAAALLNHLNSTEHFQLNFRWILGKEPLLVEQIFKNKKTFGLENIDIVKALLPFGEKALNSFITIVDKNKKDSALWMHLFRSKVEAYVGYKHSHLIIDDIELQKVETPVTLKRERASNIFSVAITPAESLNQAYTRLCTSGLPGSLGSGRILRRFL